MQNTGKGFGLHQVAELYVATSDCTDKLAWHNGIVVALLFD